MPTPRPRQPAPDLTIDLLDGSTWSLADQEPEHFTMLVFYRGLHCPVCKKYLRTLSGLRDDLTDMGVDVLAVSMDDEARARTARKEWEVGGVPIAYGLTEPQARDWGLYLSEAIKEAEPELFSEPGLFLVRPDGTLYYAAINSMPFGRPDLTAMTKSIGWILENDYPARGEVADRAMAL